MKIIISCEHATNSIPARYKPDYCKEVSRLDTHEGYDIGAIAVARKISKQADFFLAATVSRLLVDFNRSLHHRQIFSNVSKKYEPELKNQIIQDYYLPYRKTIMEKISAWVKQGELVVHLSVHSFSPILNNVQRETEIGLLYDSGQKNEKHFCDLWQKNLYNVTTNFRVRKNYPYHGKSDGLCTFLRKKFSKNYIGIELEINQALLLNKKSIAPIANLLNDTFYLTIANYKKREK